MSVAKTHSKKVAKVAVRETQKCAHPSVQKLGTPGRLYVCVDCGSEVRL